MIACSKCKFRVRAHEYDGKQIDAESDSCPLCKAVLIEESPEPIQFIERRLGKTLPIIDGSQFIFHDKIVLNRVEKFARETGVPKDLVMAAAKQFCAPCRKAQTERD